MEAFSRMSKLHLVDRGLCAFRSGVSGSLRADTCEASESVVYQWVNVLCKALGSIHEVLPQDAGAVVQIVGGYVDKKALEKGSVFAVQSRPRRINR